MSTKSEKTPRVCTSHRRGIGRSKCLKFQVSAIKIIKALSKIGYEADHQTGSHVILRHKGVAHKRLTVPNRKEIARGTLKAIIEEAGLTIQEFTDLL
ncbi:MAG: type II toxin-antitoxin system HicA family toxin [Nitrosotalea sp.]